MNTSEPLYQRTRQHPEKWDRHEPRFQPSRASKDAVKIIIDSTAPFAVLKSRTSLLSGTTLLITEPDARRLGILSHSGRTEPYDGLRVVEVDDRQNLRLNRLIRGSFAVIDLGADGVAYEPSDRVSFQVHYARMKQELLDIQREKAKRARDQQKIRQRDRLRQIAAAKRKRELQNAQP